MNETIIRKATLDDKNGLLLIEQGIIAAERAFTPLLKPDPIFYYDLDEMLTGSAFEVVVAVIGNELIASGYARIETPKPYYKPAQQAYLGMMYVAPGHRGKGINSLILQKLKELVKQRGIDELCLEVFSANEAAIKAYKKAGFQEHMIQMRMSLDENNGVS